MDENILKNFKLNPSFREGWKFYRGKRTRQHILEQKYCARFANITVTRSGTVARISWVFHPDVKNPNKFQVTGLVREMSLVPDDRYDMDSFSADTLGDGSIQLQLAEGRSYYFEFWFYELEELDKGLDLREWHSKHCDTYWFQVAVPLSDEHKVLLEKLDDRPEEQVRQRVKGFVSLRRALKTRLQEGIEDIKRMKLPPNEEEKEIADLTEDVERLKEQMGL